MPKKKAAKKKTPSSRKKATAKAPAINVLRSSEEIARDEIMELVDQVTEPKVMPDWKKAFHFLRELASDIQCRAEVLQEEHDGEDPFQGDEIF